MTMVAEAGRDSEMVNEASSCLYARLSVAVFPADVSSSVALPWRLAGRA